MPITTKIKLNIRHSIHVRIQHDKKCIIDCILVELQTHRILQILQKVFFTVITALDSVSKISDMNNIYKVFFQFVGLVLQSTIFAGF